LIFLQQHQQHDNFNSFVNQEKTVYSKTRKYLAHVANMTLCWTVWQSGLWTKSYEFTTLRLQQTFASNDPFHNLSVRVYYNLGFSFNWPNLSLTISRV